MSVLFGTMLSVSMLVFGASAGAVSPSVGAVAAFVCSAALQSETTDGQTGTPRSAASHPPRELRPSDQQENYLGVVTAPVPPALATQLSDRLKDGQGLLITQVLVDSPARRAGLQQYDVLSAYHGQPLTSSAELKQLIVAGEAGRSVKLGVIRGGQRLAIAVTLGRRAIVTRNLGGGNGLPQLSQTLPATEPDDIASVNRPEFDRPAVARRPLGGSRNVTVVITQLDEGETTVDIHLVDAQRQSQRWRLTGTKQRLLAQMDKLPAAIHETVRRSLDQTNANDEQNRALRLQFQPRLDNGAWSYRILFCRPAAGGGTRVLGLEQTVGVNDKQVLAELLQNRELNRELDSLSPQVRSKLQGALKTLPAIEPPTETSSSQ